MSNAAKKTTLDEVWDVIKELGESQKKTEESMREVHLAQQKTEKSLRESEQRTQKRMAKLDELFTGQWGKLMESLVRGDLVRLLNEREIEVTGLSQETSRIRGGKEYQFDIIAINGAQIVVVEVKTTLRLKDIDHFIKKLRAFKKVFPEYSKKEIFGAVAYLKANEASDKNAQKRGLFVIRATGNSASITNPENFEPKAF